MRSGRLGWFSLVLLAACEPLPPSAPARAPAVATVAAPEPAPRRALFAPARHAGPALGLTASDGTGLRLVSLRARSIVQDPLGFTELRLAFENPQDRTLEGTFRITLPQGASVSRLSMRIGDRWQEGEVVEKQAARQAYEDFLHRRQDPALLEQAAGNEFSARIFPIPARSIKEIVLSYSHEQASSGEPFRLPLGGLPLIEQLDAEVFDGSGKLLGAFRQERSQPEGDFVIELAPQDRSPASAAASSWSPASPRSPRRSPTRRGPPCSWSIPAPPGPSASTPSSAPSTSSCAAWRVYPEIPYQSR